MFVRSSCKYSCSTFVRAHGVLRKNLKLDLMLGSCVKQRTGTAAPIASHPIRSDSCVMIISSVMPSILGLFAGFLVALIFFKSNQSQMAQALLAACSM
jgi:hypothetical protein